MVNAERQAGPVVSLSVGHIEGRGERQTSMSAAPTRDPVDSLSTLVAQVLVAFTIEVDNEFEQSITSADPAYNPVSLSMWTNFMQFVLDAGAITADELTTRTHAAKEKIRASVGCMERWGYITVDTEAEDGARRRTGWGSAQGVRAGSLLRPTECGRVAGSLWRPLVASLEARWEERFGKRAVERVRRAAAELVSLDGRVLPPGLPVVGPQDGFLSVVTPLPFDGSEADRRRRATSLDLVAALAHLWLAFALEFEQEAELSLPLSANVLRVLDEPVPGRDLPRVSGISREAAKMALAYLERHGYARIGPDPDRPRTPTVTLTEQGLGAREQYLALLVDIEDDWSRRFGKVVAELREALLALVAVSDGKAFADALVPHDSGWRASAAYAAQTEAFLSEPRRFLPQAPLTLFRGGWPDGS